MKRFFTLAACVALSVLVLSSCWSDVPLETEESQQRSDEASQQQGTGESQEQGTVRVLITDAPAAEIDEAWVTITRIELIRDDERRTTLSDEPRAFDLLTLQDGEALEMAQVAVDEGTYTELRLFVADEAHVEFDDESTMTLKVPGGASSGIKVKLPPFTLESETDEIEITVDFDFGHSFVRAGNSGKYIFKPVMRPKSMLVNGESVAVPGEDGEAG